MSRYDLIVVGAGPAGSGAASEVQQKLSWPYFKYRLARLGMPFHSKRSLDASPSRGLIK